MPKRYVSDIKDPLIFLLGPIRGAPEWQNNAIEILFSINPDLVIVTPTRHIKESLRKYLLPGIDNHFERQRAWEIHYTEMASEKKETKGCAMFWLPKRVDYNVEKDYGAITREEWGLMLGNYRHDNSLRFCVGTDGGFSEWRTHLLTLNTYAPNKRVFESLKYTCREAVRIAA